MQARLEPPASVKFVVKQILANGGTNLLKSTSTCGLTGPCGGGL